MERSLQAMYQISKKTTFEAAHQIVGHKDPVTGEDGKCSRLHGHSYEIGVVLTSNSLNEIGFVIDYYWVGSVLKRLASRWDHNSLNDFIEFQAPHNSTAERIAWVVCSAVRSEIEAMPDEVKRFVVVKYAWAKETDGTDARYYI